MCWSLAKTTRTLIEVKLFDISPVTFAAYTETSAEVRAQAEDQARIAARKRLAFMRRQLDLLESQFDTVRRGRSSTHRRR
jgi:phage head maturation protease